jgi:hypothetical protein
MIMRRRVVFPAPFGPRIAVTWRDLQRGVRAEVVGPLPVRTAASPANPIYFPKERRSRACEGTAVGPGPHQLRSTWRETATDECGVRGLNGGIEGAGKAIPTLTPLASARQAHNGA